MLAKDLIKKEKVDLQKLASETRAKLEKSKMEALSGKGVNLEKIRTLRKDYARIRTVINQKGK